MVDANFLSAVNAYKKIQSSPAAQGAAPELTVNKEGLDFTELVEKALQSAVGDVKQADNAVSASLTGQISLEELAISIANAEVGLKSIVAVRDRIISAFQDIIRMPI